MRKFVKRPGADWEVIYQCSDGTYSTATIFGMNDITQLGLEIYSALPEDADLVQIKRIGFPDAVYDQLEVEQK